MKKTLLSMLLLVLCGSVFAQDKAGTLKPYGFVRNFFAFDTRESLSGTEDFFYYVPKDVDLSSEGVDLNEQATFRFAALTTRLGVDLVGFEYEGFKIGGKIETDFYSGVSGVTGTATLRLRQAYATIGRNNWLVTAGQAWHPMAADMPDVFSLNTGAPFGPFSRTPQVKVDWKVADGISFTGSALWQMQYTSAGPGGASANYIKYGCTPELYFGVSYTDGGFTGRIGVDMLSIKPRWNNGVKKVSDRITTVSPFVYAQYKKDLFSVKVKSIFAQAGEHFNLNGGYGVSAINQDGSYEYTPTRNSSTWVSLAYGKKVQYILFGGYVRNFGTKENLYGAEGNYAPASYLYFSKNSYSNMNRMWRLTPTIIRNIGKFALGIECEITSVQYGDYYSFGGAKYLGVNGLATDNLHWVTNNRVQALMKFTF
ncbi:MAG: hypothetical protein J6Z47_06675 [Bacteroidales bacterium]|nr:hypothetical protein [Bacteroidales bacterium]